jgi:hypothetical protein
VALQHASVGAVSLDNAEPDTRHSSIHQESVHPVQSLKKGLCGNADCNCDQCFHLVSVTIANNVPHIAFVKPGYYFDTSCSNWQAIVLSINNPPPIILHA